MAESLIVPRRFNGPLESGNGGYCSGLAAGFVGGAAEVSLRAPVPLETPLEVRNDHGSVVVVDGETLVIEATAAEPEVELPEPVSVPEARRAEAGYRGPATGFFSRCFVCGRTREDAFGVFAGPVEGRQIVASSWMPAPWTAGDGGRVSPEFVWAVLDCPTYFAAYLDRGPEEELPVSVLARLTARIDGPVIAGSEHVVIAWAIEADGRKQYAGSAVLNAAGEPLAVARALLIEPRGA